MVYNIIVCGVGGQGVMLISTLLGLACAESGYGIRTAETHGLAQRSGSIYAHVRIDERMEAVNSSLVPYGEADIIVGVEAMEILRNIEYLKKDANVVCNNFIWYPVQSTFVRVKNPDKLYITIEEIISNIKKISNNIIMVNATELAKKAGNPLTTNMVLAGVLTKIDRFPLSLKQLKDTLPQVVPKKAIEANLKALELGAQLKP